MQHNAIRSPKHLLCLWGVYVRAMQGCRIGPAPDCLHVPFIQHVFAPHQVPLVELYIFLRRRQSQQVITELTVLQTPPKAGK